jgi:hypothetical protein
LEGFLCTHGFARLCLAPHGMWGQKPLMLFSLFFEEHHYFEELNRNMEIKVRNVDPIAVKKIDEMAKEKKISRSEFLKGQIETFALLQLQKDHEAALEDLIDKNIKMMEKCAVAIERMNGFIEEMVEYEK